jgi:hypothetical protein
MGLRANGEAVSRGHALAVDEESRWLQVSLREVICTPPSEARKMEDDMLIIGMRTSTPAQAVNKSISPESMFWSWIMIFVNFFSHMYHYTISRS